MRAVRAIAGVELRRFLRDRANIFFVFVLPMMLVLLIGSQFGGGASQGQVSVAGDESRLRSALVSALEDRDVEVSFADPDDVRQGLARGRADVGVFLSGEDAAAYAQGRDVDVETVAASQAGSQVAVQVVRTAVEKVATDRAVVLAVTEAGVPMAQAETAVTRARDAVRPAAVSVRDVNDVEQDFAGLGQFDLGATSQTLLFVFFMSLAGSATLIQARRYGVVRRTLAAPVSTGRVITGQALGRFTIALVQGGYIMLASALLFDVDWGNPLLSLLVLTVFAAVAAAAAMVIGSVMDNDGAASGVGVGAGLMLGALGGCMTPLEFFPDTLQTVAHITPHAWAYDAFAEIQRNNGTLADIAAELGVLAAMAAALLLLGTLLLRRSLTRSALSH